MTPAPATTGAFAAFVANAASAALRPYQREAVAEALAVLTRRRAALLVLPTGTGKTVIFATVAAALRPAGRVLVLAHREELIRQAEEKIRAWTSLSVAVEMAEARAAGTTADVVVASVQTLAREPRLTAFPPDAFGLVIVDEAHHATAETYRRIADYFASAKVLGVTATPDRLDGIGLRNVFEVAPYVYELRDAIEDGWLVPIRQTRVEVDGVDLSRVRTVAGDLHEGDLEHALLDPAALHGIAAPIARHAAARPTLVFAVTVKHAEALAETLGAYAGPEHVAALSGGDARETRRATLEAFAGGEVQYLVNCMLFGEGVDIPAIACVAVARPTKSRALYAQMIGRGTRLAPGKADLLVLDFKGSAGKHALVSTFDVLSGARDEDVERRAQRIMNAETVSILDAVRQAEAEIGAEERQQAVRVESRLVEIDPFTVLGIHAAPGRWGGKLMTDKQRDWLVRAGIPTARLDRGQASALIDEIIRRRGAGLSTFRQQKLLLRHGYAPDVTFDEASQLIAELAANGWRRPALGVSL
jgi:superfamily II DNA or RNA helicase